jgi:hypothetical protein
MLTTVSLPLAVWGSGYDHFISRWQDGVRSLTRQPDEIVVVTDEANKHVLDKIELHIKVQKHTLPHSDYRLWDFAIRQCTSKWVAICNIDDQFLPEALNEIDEADRLGANLLIDCLEVKGGTQVWFGDWIPERIPQAFTMPGAEPMTKELYLAGGGYDYNYQFPDWALAVNWVKKADVRPYKASTSRIIFDPGWDRKTLSGQQQDSSVKVAGTAQVHELSRSLGLL